MILSPKQVLELVKTPIDPVIGENKKLQDAHKVHIQGTGFESVLKQIVGYENVEQFHERKLLTKPFTRPLFKKIMNAQSRWKSAWGTQKFYQFQKNSEELSKDFKEQVLSQVWKNTSIETFVKEFLSKAIYQEFNGFLLVEKPQVITDETGTYQVREGIYKTIEGDVTKPYICFKSVEEVYKFKVTGKTVEFIVLAFGEIDQNGRKIQLYRVIDDRNDYIVEKEGNKVELSKLYPVIEHKAGRCPVVSMTYINKELINDKSRTSPVDDIIQLLDYHLHQFAEHLVSEILHAHPNFFQVGQRCVEVFKDIKCDGGRIAGQSNGQDINIQCPSCKGTGLNQKKDASTIQILPAMDEMGNGVNITAPAGYVTPPVDILTYQQNSIDWMEEKILEAALGVNNFTQSEGLQQTATGVIANLKPLEDIISEIIDIIEGVETALTDILGKMYYGDKYVRSEIIYGRKLTLRDENTLLREIKESKEAGASGTHIKSLNEELTYSRFIRSNSDLQRNIILNELEPLIGLTFKEIEDSNNIPKTVKLLKQNFTDLIQRFEMENGNLNDFMPGKEQSKKVNKIREILLGYIELLEEQMSPESSQEPPVISEFNPVNDQPFVPPSPLSRESFDQPPPL